MSKGLISILPGTPRLVEASEPKISLKALLNKKDRRWKKDFSQLNILIKKIQKVERIETVSLSKGENLYYQNAIEIYENVKKELLVILGRLTPVEKDIDVITPTKLMHKKGVVSKAIIPIDKRNSPMVKKLVRLGVEIRSHDVKGLRLHIVDGEYAMITIVEEDDPKNRNIIKIKQKESAQVFRNMFLSLWDKASIL